MKISKLKKLQESDKNITKNIIDIREKHERTSGYIKGSTHIVMNNLLSNPSKYLNKNERYYILCASGSRSGMTTLMLKLKGYKVSNISGGYMSYR